MQTLKPIGVTVAEVWYLSPNKKKHAEDLISDKSDISIALSDNNTMVILLAIPILPVLQTKLAGYTSFFSSVHAKQLHIVSQPIYLPSINNTTTRNPSLSMSSSVVAMNRYLCCMCVCSFLTAHQHKKAI